MLKYFLNPFLKMAVETAHVLFGHFLISNFHFLHNLWLCGFPLYRNIQTAVLMPLMTC